MDDHHRFRRRNHREVYQPGDNEPYGFILTTILGILGAFVATYLGQALGWYRPGEGAGLIGAIVGAIVVLFVYGMVTGRSRRAI
ncbi:putative membrane protein YeaQ/YmgE (transglycosylase-associated protein family) [Bradyrhizobium japonicum]|nr:putative membrane protein YeaQ/YmgE (transglycosylase-associated protein family) [Bradyrhizobium japonicum]MCS3964442.1 putative membrane protein YeaQ/YmgE (transglycosylase-associated protein family) [Bradyrhizobium japonicum]MCS3996752.1 putative membrane protein YeaQ/YmgE (transglycosylase-associated protein family) [Bradyrhizobium japonicum]